MDATDLVKNTLDQIPRADPNARRIVGLVKEDGRIDEELTAEMVDYAMKNGVNFLYLFLLVPAELIILLFERGAYRVYLDCTPKKATAYAVTANLTSAILGYFIMEPVWRFVVSIS